MLLVSLPPLLLSLPPVVDAPLLSLLPLPPLLPPLLLLPPPPLSPLLLPCFFANTILLLPVRATVDVDDTNVQTRLKDIVYALHQLRDFLLVMVTNN
ncbi:MAG: hypothetical protein WBQ25_09705 [Nitrososphaeraceae archaeon]